MKFLIACLLLLLVAVSPMQADTRVTDSAIIVWDAPESPAASVIFSSYTKEINVDGLKILTKQIITQPWLRVPWLPEYVYLYESKTYLK